LGDDKNAVLMHFGVTTQIRPKWTYVVCDLYGRNYFIFAMRIFYAYRIFWIFHFNWHWNQTL